MRPILATLILLAGLIPVLRAADRPNILWITSEDNSWNWLGCYGNPEAVTPRLDALARESVLFSHAYSNAPVCAVARSTILNGAYAVTQGTQHMRSRHPIPAIYKPYVSYLRGQGYYCTNRSKTDYNFEGRDDVLWDECASDAHYKNRPDGKPFFAVVNLTVSHESSLFPGVIARNRKNGTIPRSPRMDPAKVNLPAYLPDLPEIRSDIAIYHDTITALDTQVGKLLDELQEAGLADDTIIFYYSDHGGIIPRGKRYLEDTGVRVPMIVHVPEKWRALSPFEPGKTVDEIVSFVDLAPTLLSLVGIEKPAQMQGRAFLGTKRVAPPQDPVAFLFADRFDEIYGMRRGITDARWKYIRSFAPQLPAAPYSYYQFGQAGWTAWQQAWKDGKLAAPHRAIWETPQPVECLFDLSADPLELKNLAGDPAHATRLAGMRERLKSEMIDVLDTGIIPEPMFSELAPGKPVASWLAKRKSEVPALVSLAFTASAPQESDVASFIAAFSSEDPVTRYWAAQGCLNLGKAATPAIEGLLKLLGDPSASVSAAAGEALYFLGKKEEGKAALLARLEQENDGHAELNLIGVITRIQALDDIPDAWVMQVLKSKRSEYVMRLARRLRDERQ